MSFVQLWMCVCVWGGVGRWVGAHWKLFGVNLTFRKRKHRCDAYPCVCFPLHDHSKQNACHPHLSSYSEYRCHSDPSLARVLQWSPLTLMRDPWHLGHGQGQKVSDGRRATRALPWLAPLTCALLASSAALTSLAVCTSHLHFLPNEDGQLQVLHSLFYIALQPPAM